MEEDMIIFVNTDMVPYKQQEFKELLKACAVTLIKTFTQDVKSIDFRTYIGSGKVQEIANYLQEHNADAIYFDIALTPLQVRNLEEVFLLPVIDREELILEIFNRRANTKTAKLQIELARLKKLLPRLIGANTQLSRQAGGKNRGAGEQQLELDRRRIKARITEVKKALNQVKKEHDTQRRQRSRTNLPLVALVGYTNAGKSTIMNAFLQLASQGEHKQVLQKDMLFATLDTSVRKISLKDMPDFLLSDTVGFVSDLPHHLIDAFTSTLEEITYADVILQVVDASNEHYREQMETTAQVLQEIHAAHIPMITVYNKCDMSAFSYPQVFSDHIYISAKLQTGLSETLQLIQTTLYSQMKPYEVCIPYEKAEVLSALKRNHNLYEIHHKEDGIHGFVYLTMKQAQEYQSFLFDDCSKN